MALISKYLISISPKSFSSNFDNTSASGIKMGETYHSLGFADFGAYQDFGIIQAAVGAKVDFNSNWATRQVSKILRKNPTLIEYALNARLNHPWDIKSHTPNGNAYYSSKLFGKYSSARFAGNFAAGAVAQESYLPNIFSNYSFGVYNQSGNFYGKIILKP